MSDDKTQENAPATDDASDRPIDEPVEPADLGDGDGGEPDGGSVDGDPVPLVEPAEPVAAGHAPEPSEPVVDEDGVTREAAAEAPVVPPATAVAPPVDAPASDSAASDTGPDAAASAPAEAGAPATGTTAAAQVVYVQAPVPPRMRGNRGIGVLLAVVGAIVFIVAYAAIAALVVLVNGGQLASAMGDFLLNAIFWVPVLLFLVAFVVLVLVLNRAGWWAHVLGSLLVGLAVYFGTIGVRLLIGNALRLDEPVDFGTIAMNPFVILAALLAREVSIWIGLGIAARGRRVRVRNEEAREAFDREQALKRAEYERAGAAQG